MLTLRSAKKFLIASFLLLIASSSFAARTAPIDIPAPVTVPQGKTMAAVKEAIDLAAVARKWTIKEISPGVLEARVNVRNKHTLIVDVKYDTQQVTMSYKDSVNLEYENGIIHRNANSWMKNLMGDIKVFLNR